MQVADELIRTAMLAVIEEPAEFPPGKHEIRFGVEGVASGFHSSFGVHGFLTVKPTAKRGEDLLLSALAVLIAKLPARDRARILKELPARAAANEPQTLPHAKAAARLLRALEKKTGIAWRATPTYKAPKV